MPDTWYLVALLAIVFTITFAFSLAERFANDCDCAHTLDGRSSFDQWTGNRNPAG